MDEEYNSYLIPANAKRSTLILGWFTPMDLVIFGIGLTFTILMLLTIGTNDLDVMILIVLPALISTTLVLPIPHYHNVIQLLINIYKFFSERRNYRWKGWSIAEYEDEK